MDGLEPLQRERTASTDDGVMDPDAWTVSTAEIHLANLVFNLEKVKHLAEGADIMAVVKANAYGHGAVRVARFLQQRGVHYFAVATIPEGVELRDAGIRDPILVFGSPRIQHLPAYSRYDLDVTVASEDVARAVLEMASPDNPFRVQVNVETGMHRLGLDPELAPQVICELHEASDVRVTGVWSHYATAGEPDSPAARHQFSVFERVVETGRVAEIPDHIHIANSSALLSFPECIHQFRRPMVRVGISLYGYSPRSGLRDMSPFRPVMALRTQVVQVKTLKPNTPISYGHSWQSSVPARIATLGAGYADGYPRALSNTGEVVIQGQQFPVAGTICMDMTMVNLGNPEQQPDVRSIQVGDHATLFGPEGPTAMDLALELDTIPYELLCRVSERVPRRYIPVAEGEPADSSANNCQ